MSEWSRPPEECAQKRAVSSQKKDYVGAARAAAIAAPVAEEFR